jgi:hypothetical protein
MCCANAARLNRSHSAIAIGWAKERSDVPTIYHRSSCEMVGTLRSAHPVPFWGSGHHQAFAARGRQHHHRGHARIEHGYQRGPAGRKRTVAALVPGHDLNEGINAWIGRRPAVYTRL